MGYIIIFQCVWQVVSPKWQCWYMLMENEMINQWMEWSTQTSQTKSYVMFIVFLIILTIIMIRILLTESIMVIILIIMTSIGTIYEDKQFAFQKTTGMRNSEYQAFPFIQHYSTVIQIFLPKWSWLVVFKTSVFSLQPDDDLRDAGKLFQPLRWDHPTRGHTVSWAKKGGSSSWAPSGIPRFQEIPTIFFLEYWNQWLSGIPRFQVVFFESCVYTHYSPR